MKRLIRNITHGIQAIVLMSMASVANASFINLDFNSSGGVLDDGTTYSISFLNSDYGVIGSGFYISDNTLVVTFSNAVNLNIRANTTATGTWNNIADGTVQFDVVGGTLAIAEDTDDEISTVIGDGTANLDINFRYEGAGPQGPNNNDFVSSNQNWLISGTTASTLTLIHDPLQTNSSAFEIAAEGVPVPAPLTIWMFAAGLLLLLRGQSRGVSGRLPA